MKRSRLELHLNYCEHLKKNFEKRTTLKLLLTDHILTNKRVFEVSYQISLFIAKSGKSYHRRELNETINIGIS